MDFSAGYGTSHATYVENRRTLKRNVIRQEGHATMYKQRCGHCQINELKLRASNRGDISNYLSAFPLPDASRSGLQIGSQTFATSTEQIHSSDRHRVHAGGLLNFSVKVGTSHNAKLQVG